MMKPYAGQTFTKELPLKRSTPQEILKLVKQYNSLTDVQWKKGKVSGGIYASMDNNELIDLMTQVFGETAYTNPLHPDVFPGVRKMEVEVVRIACDLFHGDDNSCGTMTTGGTESIVMACKAMRDYARAVKGIKHPEMIAPITVHAGFDKAAEYMNIRLIHVPVDSKTGKVNVTAMKRAITKNTIMLIGSSPNFPHGIIDPIPEIADLGLKYDIPVHVDACLGGWLLPFMREADYPVPVGDFSIPGVTSISADTHKYGYAPKGSSVVLYREPKYRHYQYSVCTDWPGGVYASPTVSGSRAGANIATCWASILFHGREGFVESTKKVIDAARKLKKAIQCTPGLQLVGDPLMSVVAATSNQFNVLEMSDQLTKRGWNLNTLQFPPAFHVCLTLMHTKEGVLDLLIQDIQSIAENLRKSPPSALTGQAAVYGMAAAIPDRSMIGDIAKHYLDAYYATD
jgi:sphinganine-1-phosphate aldolase